MTRIRKMRRWGVYARRTALFAILLTGTATSGRAQQSTTTSRIQGVLLEERTRAPIVRGAVRLINAEGRAIHSVRSDSEGGFSLWTPGPGTYHLEAEQIGYRTKGTGEFTLPPGRVLSVEVHLQPAPQDTATGLIDGVLVDEETGGRVFRGVVRLLTPDGQTMATVESDREGRFSLQTPGPGTFRLRVSALGYQTKESGAFSIPPSHVLSVEIRLAPAPLPLDPMEIVGRPTPLRATEQLIQGRLLDYESGDPIPQGMISLLKTHGSDSEDADLLEQVLSDNRGRFAFITPLPATYRLRGERIGYRSSDSPDLHMMPGDTIVLDFYLDVEAIVLDPLTVRASARPWSDRYNLMGMESFFYRYSRFSESGFGTFLTRDSLATYEGRMETGRMLLASVMDVRMVNTEGGVILAHGCNPRYYLDGVEIVRGDPVQQSLMGVIPSTPISSGVDPELSYPPERLEGVEVYLSPTIPAEFSQGFPCGVVALWTRRRR